MGRLRRHCLRKNVECFMVPVAGSPEINVKPSFWVRCGIKIQCKITVYVCEWNPELWKISEQYSFSGVGCKSWRIQKRWGQKGRERKNNPSLFPSSGTDSPRSVFFSVLQCLIWVNLLTNFFLCIWQSRLLTTLRICSFSHHFNITYCVLLDRTLVYLLYYFSPSF